MTEEAKTKIKSALELAGQKVGKQWHAQETHKLVVGQTILDLAEIKDPAKRGKILAAWMDGTPSALGANCSALAQALGRETAQAKINRSFADC